MKIRLISLVVIVLVAAAFKSVEKPFFSVPKGWPQPTYDFSKNQLSKENIMLGRALFHDPILSRDSTISCTSCHSQYSGFTHTDHDLSHGIEDRIGTRNSPALMNLAWHQRFMWDGAIHHLDMQALAPISHPDEMDESIENVVLKLQQSPRYRAAFYRAYADSTITGQHLLKALSQFMLTFVSANSKYDKVMRNEAGIDFTEQEKNGYRLFQMHCGACHQEPLFTNHQFANNGLAVDTTLSDFGRMRVTINSNDSLKFKVPTLRNIEFTFPYMHDGRFRQLSQVMDHYTGGIQKSPTLAPELQTRLPLSANEKVDITAFLLTLSDREFLFNKDYAYPRAFFAPQQQSNKK